MLVRLDTEKLLSIIIREQHKYKFHARLGTLLRAIACTGCVDLKEKEIRHISCSLGLSKVKEDFDEVCKGNAMCSTYIDLNRVPDFMQRKYIISGLFGECLIPTYDYSCFVFFNFSRFEALIGAKYFGTSLLEDLLQDKDVFTSLANERFNRDMVVSTFKQWLFGKDIEDEETWQYILTKYPNLQLHTKEEYQEIRDKIWDEVIEPCKTLDCFILKYQAIVLLAKFTNSVHTETFERHFKDLTLKVYCYSGNCLSDMYKPIKNDTDVSDLINSISE